MSVLTILRNIGLAILGFAGAGAILGGVAVWVGKLVSDRLYLSTSAKYERELETLRNRYSTDLEQLRAQLANQRDALGNVHSALASGYVGAHERVVTAIEFLWNNIVETRTFVDSFMFFYQILLPEEYVGVSADAVAKIQSMIPSTAEFEFHEATQRLREGIDVRRPFLGENVWLLQRVYFAFAMRIAFKIQREREQGKFFEWNRDSDGTPDQMQQMLSFAFSEEELAALLRETDPLSQLGVPHRVLDALESRILAEMNAWIFGKRLVSMSVEEQWRMERVLGQARSDVSK